jgi:Icc-related predicted phosphoesterase
LENDFVEIEGLKIWGSPITPTFGTGWAFNKNRAKTHEVWAKIPDGTDIVVVHGPPKGVLDLSYDRLNQLEFCGDNSLKKKMLSLNPKLVCFGHIHNCEDIINAGTMKLSVSDTIYSNGSVVTDGKFGKLSSNGNIFEI